MEVSNNTESSVSTTNFEKIGKDKEKMFLRGNKRIKRAVTGDVNDIGEIKKGIKPF